MSAISMFGRIWRHTFLARFLNTLHWLRRRVRLHPGALLLSDTADLHIGKGSKIGAGCVLQAQRATLNIGKSCWLYRDVEFRTATHMHIGDNVTFQTGVLLNGTVSVGGHCIFAPRVFVSSGTHIFQWQPELPIQVQEALYAQSPEGHLPYQDRPVTIGEDCWIGVNAVIMPGVSIGRGCVIGANAVVTSDVPPYSIMAGAPARPLRKRLDWNPPTVVDCGNPQAVPYLYSGFQIKPDPAGFEAWASGNFSLAVPSATAHGIELHLNAQAAGPLIIAGQRFELTSGENTVRAVLEIESLTRVGTALIVPCELLLPGQHAIRLYGYQALG